MQGLYYPDGTFKDDSEIKRDLYERSIFPDPILETPLPEDRNFAYWSGRFRRRQAEFLETRERVDHVEIRFSETTCLNFIGDIHAGSPDTRHERLEREVEVIVNTPNSYILLFGDAIDGYFWNPGQFDQVEQVPEQIEYYHALIRYLSDKKKLLVGWGGDHDGWADKMGHSANARFSRDTGAYYMHGVGYVTAKVGDQVYNITGTHRPQGASIYNNAHGAMRLGRDAEGSDIVVTAHQHSKAVTQQPVKEYAGRGRLVTYIALGAYKSTDKWTQKMGFANNPTESMFGASVIIDKDMKRVTPFYDILQANMYLSDSKSR